MGRRIVIGDIHGCLKTFRQLVEDRIRLLRNDMLFLVGDLIDRGPASKGVIDYVMDLQDDGFHPRVIRGNHEQMMLDYVEDSRFLANWLHNGAEPTIRSFGLPFDLVAANQLQADFPGKYIRFMNELEYYIELDDAYIVHAGFNFSVRDPFSDTRSMIWSRENLYDAGKASGKRIIHGHTPVPLASITAALADRNNRLVNIDGGCVYNQYPGLGNLVGLDLDRQELFVQENREEK